MDKVAVPKTSFEGFLICGCCHRSEHVAVSSINSLPSLSHLTRRGPLKKAEFC